MAGSTAMTFKLFGHDVSASKTFKDVGKTAAGVASGMGVAFAASKVTDWAKDSMKAFSDVGKETLKLQRYMGGSAEESSRLGHAFKMSGVDSEKSARALGIFSKALSKGSLEQDTYASKMAEVENGTSKTIPTMGAMAKKFEELGISTKDANGKTREMKDVLMDVADKFQTMPAGADRTALAISLFGKAGADMLPFLSRGSAGIAELMKQSDALGTTMSGKDAQAVKDFTKTQREWGEVIKGVEISLGRALYPTLTKLGNTILPLLLPKIQMFTAQMAKAPDIIEQKWPKIEAAIKTAFLKVEQFQKTIRDNWPAIKDTFSRVGDALKRVGEWTKMLWDKFQSLPGPVKELIAMLAIAQKTGVLSIAFKGLDLAKNLVAKIAGMVVQAGTVIVNGAAGAGSTAASGASAAAGNAGKGAGAIAATLGKLGGWAAAAYVLYLALNNAWDVLTQKKSPGDGLFYAMTRFVPEGNVLHSVVKLWGGIWDMVTGKAQRTSDAMRGLHWWDGVLTIGQQRLADQVGNANLSMAQRMLVLSKLRDAGAIEIQSLRDQGASQEAIEQKTIKWKDAIQKAGEKLGWTQAQIDAYKGKLDSIPYGKETIIRARTGDASRSVLGLASTINGVVHPPPILFSADPSGAIHAINLILQGLSMVRSAGDMARIRWGFGVRQFATGGIVTQATMGIIGEAGPEAVIPLNRAGNIFNGGSKTEVHVHVSGSVFATKEQMAREVVAALQNAKNRGLQLNLAG